MNKGAVPVPDDLAIDHLLTVQLSLKVAPTSSYSAAAPRRPSIPVIPSRPVVTTSPPRVCPEKLYPPWTQLQRQRIGILACP